MLFLITRGILLIVVAYYSKWSGYKYQELQREINHSTTLHFSFLFFRCMTGENEMIPFIFFFLIFFLYNPGLHCLLVPVQHQQPTITTLFSGSSTYFFSFFWLSLLRKCVYSSHFRVARNRKGHRVQPSNLTMKKLRLWSEVLHSSFYSSSLAEVREDPHSRRGALFCARCYPPFYFPTYL